VNDVAPLFAPDAVVLVLFANDLPPPEFEIVRAPARRFDPRWPRLAVVVRMLAAGEMAPLRWRLRAVPYHVPASDPRQLWHGREAEVRARTREDIAAAVLAGRFNPHRVGGAGYLAPTLRTPIDLAGPLRFLAQFVARHGGRLYLAYLPDRTQVSREYARFEAALGADGIDLAGREYQRHRRELARDARSAGVPFLDLTPLLRREEGSGRRLYWDYDDHLRAAGYRLVGEALHAWWAALEARRQAASGP
jgi:hypothetical protein